MNATKSPSAFIVLTVLIPGLLAWPFNRSTAEEVLYEQTIPVQPFPIVVPTNFDGVTLPMVLDTGCYGHVLDPSMRPHFGHYNGRTTFGIIGGEMAADCYDAPDMKLGMWKLPPWTLLECDCGQIDRMLGVGLKGFLGLGPLRNVAIDVNFDRRRLRFVRSFKTPESATLFQAGEKQGGMKYVPVNSNKWGLPFFKISIEGLTVYPAIDTGATTSIGLRTETFDKLVTDGAITQISDLRVAKKAEGLGGEMTGHSGYFTRGSLFGINLNGVEVDDTKDMDLLGMLFFLHFNFVYDTSTQTFYFERRHGEPPIKYLTMMGVCFVYSEGHCRVFALNPTGGPAENAGIRKDDTILKLGPLKENELTITSVYDLCESSAGQTIDVEYARIGEQQTFKRRLNLLEKQYLYPPQP
jgi:hypothetical protein